jgi:Carbohydrate esterase, sialic acid-specific acetylesterase
MVKRRLLVAAAFLLAAFSVQAQTGGAGGAPSAPDPFALQTTAVFDCASEGGLTWNCNEPFTDTGGKTVRNLTINTGIRNLVLIIAGQSNREAEAPSAYSPTNASAIDNFNVQNGAIYAYSDPPLGSSYIATGAPTGGPGHLGGRIADKFISGGQFDRVIAVPVAIGGSIVAQWATGGPLANRLCGAIARLKARGIVPGTNVTFAIEWGQGESDNGVTSQANYTSSLNNVISNVGSCGFTGRWFVAEETWIVGTTSATIQAAQAAVINNTTVFVSGNIDSLNATNRVSDNTHLNDTGIAAAATLIYNAMHASGAPFLWQPSFAANDNWLAVDGCNDNTLDLCKAM